MSFSAKSPGANGLSLKEIYLHIHTAYTSQQAVWQQYIHIIYTKIDLTKLNSLAKTSYYNRKFNEAKGNIRATWTLINEVIYKTNQKRV